MPRLNAGETAFDLDPGSLVSDLATGRVVAYRKGGGLMMKELKMMKIGFKTLIVAIAVMMSVVTTGAWAQKAGMRVELNKLEAGENLCRVYMIFENKGPERYTAFVMDMFAFDKKGIIQKYLAIEVAPLRPNKTTIKVFEMAGVKCDDFSKIVLNDISQCAVASKPVDECLDRTTIESKSPVGFVK